MSSHSKHSSSHSRESNDWQRMMSPAPSSRSSGSHVIPLSQVDPFHGQYPSAPYLRPIELPEIGSPAPTTLGYGSGSSSRTRPMSLPPSSNGTGLGIHGMPSPPSSPQGAPSVHPLLRGSDDGSTLLIYNIIFPPSVHGSHAIRHADGARLGSHDLSLYATNPPCSALRVTLLTYAGGIRAAPQRFPWAVTLSPSRRASAPAPGQVSAPLSLGDVLASLHISLLTPVTDGELYQFSQQQSQCARAVRSARRTLNPSTPAGLVRGDFLYGCSEIAGFVMNGDNSFIVRMAPPTVA